MDLQSAIEGVSFEELPEVQGGFSSQNLAYIGDAVFELMVRTKLLTLGNRHIKDINKLATEMVRATEQAKMYHFFSDKLSETEFAVMKRGRNTKTNSRAKHASLMEYKLATGVEALFGYLYVNREFDRLSSLFETYFRENV